MAQRRMLSLKVIDTDVFLDMPSTAQALYFHLALRGDDDGFVAGPRKIMKICNASDDDYRILMAKQFIIPFDSGICVIRHWRIHNYIQKDRYQPTMYIDEMEQLDHSNGTYKRADTECIQNVSKVDTQVRLGKDRLGKDSRSRADARHTKLDVPINQKRYDILCAKHGTEKTDNAIQERMDWEASKGKPAAKDYAAAAGNWMSRETQFAKPAYGNPDFIPYNPDTIEEEVRAMRKRRAEGGSL